MILLLLEFYKEKIEYERNINILYDVEKFIIIIVKMK